MINKSQRRLFDTINEIVSSSTNSVVNRSTNTSNVSGLGSVSGTDGGGIVYKPIKPTVGTHIPKVPGMKKPGRVGFGWIADLSVVVQMLKNAGIEADDGDDPRALFQSLNRAKTAQQIAVADKMAKLTGTSIDRNTMLSDFQNAIDANTNAAKEWSKHTEEIADTLHDVKQSILSKIWKDGGTRTDRANDMVAQWSKQKMNQHAGSSPGESAQGGTERSHRDVRAAKAIKGFQRRGGFATKHRSPEDPGENRDFVPLPPGPDGWWGKGNPYGWGTNPRGVKVPAHRPKPPPPAGTGPPLVIDPDTGLPEGWPKRPGKVIPVKPEMLPGWRPKPTIDPERFIEPPADNPNLWPGPKTWPGQTPPPLLPPDHPIQTPKYPKPPWWWPFVLIPFSPLNPLMWPFYASKVDTEVE